VQHPFLPLETLPGCGVIGYRGNRDIRVLLGHGRSISSDMFYAALQNAAVRTVTTRASSIRNGREIAAVYRFDSATVVERNDADFIVRRIKQREVVIRTEADLTDLTIKLTITVNDGDRPFVLTLDDDACEELDQRLRQMQMLLESFESDEERKKREQEEAEEKERHARAAKAAAEAEAKRATEAAAKAAEAGRAAAERLVEAGILDRAASEPPTQAAAE
jgi:hypothetical protein